MNYGNIEDKYVIGCSLPWKRKRLVNHYLINPVTFINFIKPSAISYYCKNYNGDLNQLEEKRKEITNARHVFKDFNGTPVTALCHVEVIEWVSNTGWPKWISMFCKRNYESYIVVNFIEDTRLENRALKKDKWYLKDMKPDETCSDTFKRFCKEHGLTYVVELPLY